MKQKNRNKNTNSRRNDTKQASLLAPIKNEIKEMRHLGLRYSEIHGVLKEAGINVHFTTVMRFCRRESLN